ncbi:MAG: hypothetical protein ACI3WU_03150 [Phascolarctobacterium sp.]
MYENEKNYRLAVTILILGMLFILSTIFLRGCSSVSGDRTGAAAVGEQLEQARTNQSATAATLKSAREATESISSEIDSSREQINAAAGTAGQIAESSKSSGEIIRECQSVIQKIRARGKTEN